MRYEEPKMDVKELRRHSVVTESLVVKEEGSGGGIESDEW